MFVVGREIEDGVCRKGNFGQNVALYAGLRHTSCVIQCKQSMNYQSIVLLSHHFLTQILKQFEVTLIEKDHLGDWSPERDCCLRLTFQQPVRTPSSQ